MAASSELSSAAADELGALAIKLALAGLGLYLAYRVLSKGLGPAAQAITKPIAQAWVWATAGAPVQPTGKIVLPNGATIAASDISQSWFSGNAMRFTYDGQDYLIEQNPTGGPAWDTSGDYHAKAVPS